MHLDWSNDYVISFSFTITLCRPTKIVDLTFVLQKSQNFRVGIVFSIILMSLQLLDCIQRLNKYADAETNPHFPGIDYDRLASKFYSQRNLYLSGAVLYLQVAIGTVVTIVRKWF